MGVCGIKVWLVPDANAAIHADAGASAHLPVYSDEAKLVGMQAQHGHRARLTSRNLERPTPVPTPAATPNNSNPFPDVHALMW